MELPDIASLRFRQQIDESCKRMRNACGVDYFVIYLLFKNKEVFVLSNIYDHLTDYYDNAFYQQDFSTSSNLFENGNHYLCQEEIGISPTYHSMLTKKYGIHRSFYKRYHTPDFDIVIGAAHKTPHKDLSKLYQKSHEDFEKFILGFIELNLLIFKSHNPELKQSPYFNSTRVLKTLFQYQTSKQLLTPRETDCLRLTARGLTAIETAAALQISKHTVEEHKKSILSKLNAVNMMNAIYIAMSNGILEEKNQIYIPNAASILSFRNLKNAINY